MNSRLAFACLSTTALAAACLVAYATGPGSAAVALGFAAAGFVAARLRASGRARAARPAVPPAAQTAGAGGGHAQQDAPTVANAVASGELPAAALLEATMDSMREGVLVVDRAMRVVASNDSARNLFGSNGVPAAPPPGSLRLSDLTRNPAVYAAFAAAVARGERTEVKIETGREGDRRIFDLHVAPLRQREVVYGSDVRGAVGVFFDITRLERLERVRQEFLSNVSHELRTPLTAILTFVETLESGALDEPENSRRFLSVIRRNSERMHNLISDILELSAIEAGTVTVEPAPVRLAWLVGECFTSVAGSAAERRVELRNEVPADVLVYADARRLEQMITNLVENAVKFNREGGSVTVTHEREGERVRVHVADTGEGLAPEHLARIFERFYRVDRARSRALGGTGLGLAIVKHLARAHGGEATVRSAPGEGSTFTIELPAGTQ